MDDDRVERAAWAIVGRLTADLAGNCDRLGAISLEVAAAYDLDSEETAAALDHALARLKLLRLRMLHVADQRHAAREDGALGSSQPQ